jgi:surface protein
MMYMFFNDASFNQPIGGWNVSAVTDMDSMFYYAASFNQPIGEWNVSAVKKWNVSAVTGMVIMLIGYPISNKN